MSTQILCNHQQITGCCFARALCCACDPYWTRSRYCDPCAMFADGVSPLPDITEGEFTSETSGWSSTDNIHSRAVTGQVGTQIAPRTQWRSEPWMPVAVVERTSFRPARVRPARRGGAWAGLLSQPTVAPPQQQPASPSRQPLPWAGLLSHPTVAPPHQQTVAPSRQPVSWAELFSHRTVAPPQPQPAFPSRQPVPSSGFGQRELRPELGSWGDQHVWSSRQAVPTSVRVSLKKVAEEASVLLELFSQNISEGDDDAISPEQRELIVSVAAGISTIQTRLHQCTDQGTRDNDLDCTVCLADKADMVFLPCKHLVVCNACCNTMGIQEWNDGPVVPRCPVCRTEVASTIKIFRS